jgi:hypothetical protein
VVVESIRAGQVTYLPQAHKNREAAVTDVNDRHDEDEDVELVQTLHRYHLHMPLHSTPSIWPVLLLLLFPSFT